ncbi:MAG: glycosyltransferase [Desulfobacteraceae bacterium]|nr:glycosyltransferase [Desulfobacteraceae bacterium]
MRSYFSDKPIILFVIGSLEIGGAENQMYTLISHLSGHACSCHVFVLQQGGSFNRYIHELGVPTYDGGLQKSDLVRAPWKLIRAEWRLLRIIFRVKPVIVHSFLPLVTFMGALAGRMAKVPLVITSRRALGKHQERHILLRPFDLLANRLSHRVTVNSKAVWEDTVHRDYIDPGKLVLIHNGVDFIPFDSAKPFRKEVRKKLGIRSREKVIIIVANLIPYKGHSDLLEAAQVVLKNIPQVVFLLVGDDRGIGRDLKEMATDLGIAAKVKFLGLRHDIPQLLAASDLSVLPSHEEGFSNVILESMAAGLPIVATNVGGNPEAIEDGVTGWLVPPKNPTAMAEKIVDLLNDPQRARSWGKKGRKRVGETFTIERMVEAHLKLYEGWNMYAATEREYNSR